MGKEEAEAVCAETAAIPKEGEQNNFRSDFGWRFQTSAGTTRGQCTESQLSFLALNPVSQHRVAWWYGGTVPWAVATRTVSFLPHPNTFV